MICQSVHLSDLPTKTIDKFHRILHVVFELFILTRTHANAQNETIPRNETKA